MNVILTTDPTPCTLRTTTIERQLYDIYVQSVTKHLFQPIDDTLCDLFENEMSDEIDKMIYLDLQDVMAIPKEGIVKTIICYKIKPSDILYEMIIDTNGP